MFGAITHSMGGERTFFGAIPTGRSEKALEGQSDQEKTLISDLVRRVRDREAVAFENLIALTQKRAFNLAYHLLGDYYQAQDLLQEAYIRAYRYIHTLKDPMAFYSWLAKIIVNLTKEHFKSRRIIEIPEDRTLDAMEGSSPSPGILENTITKEKVREALKTLSPPVRATVLLRELYQLSYEEVSGILKIPLGTVKSRLNEARKKLVCSMGRREE